MGIGGKRSYESAAVLKQYGKGENKRERGREGVCMETMAGDQTQASGLMIFDICREKKSSRARYDKVDCPGMGWNYAQRSVRGERVF